MFEIYTHIYFIYFFETLKYLIIVLNDFQIFYDVNSSLKYMHIWKK